MSYGHLQSALPTVAFESFRTCAAAANCIAQYLESYNRVHSFQFAPFSLFYASYVSATIHVRIAAQHHLSSDASKSLQMCLSVFDQNELNNPAVKKAKAIIHKMIKRMGVQDPTETPRTSSARSAPRVVARPSASAKAKPGTEWNFKDLATPVSTPQMALSEDWYFNMNNVDFDAILQTFSRPDPGAGGLFAMDPNQVTVPPILSNSWSAADINQGATHNFTNMNHFGGGIMDDVLFGFDVSSREDEW